MHFSNINVKKKKFTDRVRVVNDYAVSNNVESSSAIVNDYADT